MIVMMVMMAMMRKMMRMMVMVTMVTLMVTMVVLMMLILVSMVVMMMLMVTVIMLMMMLLTMSSCSEYDYMQVCPASSSSIAASAISRACVIVAIFGRTLVTCASCPISSVCCQIQSTTWHNACAGVSFVLSPHRLLIDHCGAAPST